MIKNWFKVISLILLGVIIGMTIVNLIPKPPVDITPYCMDWIRASIGK